MKKLLLTFLMLIASVPLWAQFFEVDNIRYIIKSKTTVGVHSAPKLNRVPIPSTISYNGTTYSVTEIYEYAFQNHTGLIEVTIPNSVTTLGPSAFDGCTGLTKITIPNSVTSIGSSAFRGCTGLTSVTIPNSVTSLGSAAFSGCSGLTSVSLGNSITSIDDNAFFRCTGLTEVTIPNSVISIGSRVFYECSSLTNVTIPNSVTSIGSHAFFKCGALTSITIPNSVTSINSRVFYECSSLTNVTIPNSVTSIGDRAFYYCTNLSSVTIGNSVTSIGAEAFYYCYRIAVVNSHNTTAPQGDPFFEFVKQSAVLNVPSSALASYQSADGWKGFANIREMAKNGYYDFVDNRIYYRIISLTDLTVEVVAKDDSYNSYAGDVVIPETVSYNNQEFQVVSIGAMAFSRCSRLTSLTIPQTVSTIGQLAFDGCSGLYSITIRDGKTFLTTNGSFNSLPIKSWYLGRNTDVEFNNTVKMVTFAGGVTSIAESAFQGFSSLTSVTIGNSVTSIGAGAFNGCTGLTEITIPNLVTKIGTSAFEGCTGLTEVNISDLSAWCKIDFGNDSANPLSYSKKLNLNETEITELVIPNDITEIKSNTFNGCSGLTSITFPNSVTAIGISAFKSCSGLTKVTIPNFVTSIGSDAFSGCSGLTSVSLGNSIATIGSSAFYGCGRIAVINSYNTTAPQGAPFENVVKQSAILNVPSSALASYQSTDGWKDFANICEMAINGYYDFDVDGIYYRIISLTDLTVEVVAKDDTYNSYTGDVVIPETVSYRNREFNVISIGAMAFSRSVGLTSITIPQTVTSIGNSAFNGCNGLTKLILEDGEESISGLSFPDSPIETLYWGRNTPKLFMQGNTTLKVLTIGKFITKIGNSAFSGCTSLTEVTIPNSVTTIGNYAFSGCTGLTEVNISDLSAWCNIDFGSDDANPILYANKLSLNGEEIKDLGIPNDITEIKSNTFNGCSGLTQVTIPNSVTSIGSDAFSGCTGLTKLVLEDGTEQISGLSFPDSPIETLYWGRNTPKLFMQGNTTLKELTIGKFVTKIKDYMFKNCTDLTSIAMSNSITEIGASAFNGCTSLISITIPGSVTTIGESAFMNCSALTQVELLEGVTTIEPNTFNGCTSLITIKIPGSVATIEESAFMNCSALTQVELLEGVTTVGASAFNGCTSLASIAIPGSVATIGESAFMNCNALTQVEFSEGVTTVGASAFNGCTSLASIAISGSITTIGGSVFSGCTALVDVIFKNGKDAIDMGGNTFKENPLVSLYIGRTMTNVKSPFNGITTLEKVTLGSGMTSLQSDAFVGCKGIKELIIEGGEGAIAIDCKFNDSPIEKLHIGRNGTYAFNNRIDLKEVSVGDNVTILPNNAFNGCSNITTLKLGKKLEKIGSGAFTGCATLMNVYSTNLTPPTGAVFENKTYLQGTLYVVKGSKAAYEAADGWKEFWEIVDNLPFEVNGIWYNIDENGNANVVGNPSGDSYVGEFSIPASVEIGGVTYPVTSIDAEAFANALNVTSITIEDSNQPLTIGAPATAIVAMSNDQAGTFEACMLDSVYVGRNLIYATAPFANIASLKKVAVGALVTSMGGAMFAGCENIETIYALSAIPATDAEFESRVYDHATLVVPVGAVAYTTTDGWKEFVNVITTESSMVEDINIEAVTGNVSIIAVNGEIVVKGAEDAQIAVYNINGGLIYHGLNRPVAVANKGVYVVVVNGIAMKVTL